MLSWRIDLEDLPWNYFLTQVCIGFSSELHFLCHFIFHFFINEKCLFITSIHLLPFVPSFYIAALKNYITFHPTYNVWAISLLFFFCRSILWTCKLNVWWENTLSMYFYWNLFLWHLNGVASKLNVGWKDLELFHSKLSHYTW